MSVPKGTSTHPTRISDDASAAAGDAPRGTELSCDLPSDLVARIHSGVRISDEEAVTLLRSRDLLTIGELAAERRRSQVPGNRVTFIVDRNINYSNVCVTGCDFCALY